MFKVTTNIKYSILSLSNFITKRHFTLTIDNNKSLFVISKLTDPYVNLAVEEWLMKDNKNLSHACYFYRNEPTVVIGRSQNPWKECHLNNLNFNNVMLARRQSGGGTVYHDLGNINYFILMPRSDFKRITNVTLVKEALNNLNIPAQVTERKDIAVDGYKVSGSAYKISGNKAYHHGTMLLHSDLSNLKRYLDSPLKGIESKGVESVRSKVINLKKYNPEIEHTSFIEQVYRRFQNYYELEKQEPLIIDDSFLEKYPKVLEYTNRLKSWDWIYGQSPHFKLTEPLSIEWNNQQYSITFDLICKNGLIKEFILDTNTLLSLDEISDLQNLIFHLFKDLPYRETDLKRILDLVSSNNLENRILTTVLNYLLQFASK